MQIDQVAHVREWLKCVGNSVSGNDRESAKENSGWLVANPVFTSRVRYVTALCLRTGAFTC